MNTRQENGNQCIWSQLSLRSTCKGEFRLCPVVSLFPPFSVEGPASPDELLQAFVMRIEKKEEGKGERKHTGPDRFSEGFAKWDVSCCVWASGWEKKKKVFWKVCLWTICLFRIFGLKLFQAATICRHWTIGSYHGHIVEMSPQIHVKYPGLFVLFYWPFLWVGGIPLSAFRFAAYIFPFIIKNFNGCWAQLMKVEAYVQPSLSP